MICSIWPTQTEYIIFIKTIYNQSLTLATEACQEYNYNYRQSLVVLKFTARKLKYLKNQATLTRARGKTGCGDLVTPSNATYSVNHIIYVRY